MNEDSVQDLSRFKLPAGFRGRPALVVQLWWLVQGSIFRASPQFLYGFRRAVLRAFGAKIGRRVLIRPSVRIVYPWRLKIGDNSWVGDYAELYSLDEIEIGANVVISQYAYLCTGTHQVRSAAFEMVTGRIVIEDESWVAAGAFIHPGATVSRGAVIGARAVLKGPTEPYGIYQGAPARLNGLRVHDGLSKVAPRSQP